MLIGEYKTLNKANESLAFLKVIPVVSLYYFSKISGQKMIHRVSLIVLLGLLILSSDPYVQMKLFFMKTYGDILSLLVLVLILIFVVLYSTMLYELSKKFNKGRMFSLGLFFLPFIFFPILGFDKSTYNNETTVLTSEPPQ